MADRSSSCGAGEHHRVVIIGAGFSGIGAAIRLREEGIEDFVVLEAGEELGGTWWFNSYPGCQCDIPSHLYSFSFAPNPDWSRNYSLQPEIWEYLRRTASEHRIVPHIRFGCEVTDCHWEAGTERWHVTSRCGELSADLLVVGTGALHEPRWPAIEGIERFRGTIFHSARWEHRHPLRGERVAVVGTGASAIQIVPRIQPEVARLSLFQRTPPWILPHLDRSTSAFERKMYRALPATQRLMRGLVYLLQEVYVLTLMHPREGSLAERVALAHLQRQVKDPELRAKLTPRYRIGCKRTLLSNAYYPAIQRDNVEVVTERILAITPQGIRTADGRERDLDTIIIATGFHVTDFPIAGRVRDRHGCALAERWRGSPQAYLGTTIAGAPNLFMLVGPNTGLGHNSEVFMIEAQLNYMMDCIRQLAAGGWHTFEVRPEVQERFNADVQRRLQGSVWTSGGCASWYLDATGKNTTIWPGFTWPFRRRLRRFDSVNYELRRQRPEPAIPSMPAGPSARESGL